MGFKKRAIAIALVLILNFTLPACGSAFSREYFYVSEFTGVEYRGSSSHFAVISNYTDLRRALMSMVMNHRTEERLRFINYDGVLNRDLSQAAWEVRTETDLGSFAVEHISFNINRIITYYEAVIHITYRHSQSTIENVRYVSGQTELFRGIGEALEGLDEHFAFRIRSSMTQADVERVVMNAFFASPTATILPPAATVRMHPEDGLHRIIEIEINYGMNLGELREMRRTLNDKIGELVTGLNMENDAVFALEAFNLLLQISAYDPDGDLRAENDYLRPGLGSTAFGALVEGFADSMGLALAFSALCAAAGIECLVVVGSFDNEVHAWNIIRIGEYYYHLDVSAAGFMGAANSFMRSDRQMQLRYSWDFELYPECSGPLTYYDVRDGGFEPPSV